MARDIEPAPQGMPTRFYCNFSTMDAIGHVLVWVVLIILTLGLALLVFPYSFNKAILNRTEVCDRQGNVLGRLDCRFSVFSSVGHLFIWALLIIVTLGLAAFLYGYRVLRVLINETRIVYD